MKKAILLLVMGISSLYLSAQENNTWRFGVQWGAHDNMSKFSGGSPNANARFHHNEFGGGSFDLVARYDLDRHWMGTIGLGFNSFGFNFALAENYSLLTLQNRFSSVQTDFVGVEIPLMIYYKFNLNCKNARWLIGGGFAANFTDGNTVSKHFVQNNDGAASSDYLNSISTSNNGGHAMLRFAVGREKVFKRGSIFNASLIFNAGMDEIAKATVNYTVDNQNYSHSFSNKGNFVGLRLTYFFKPYTSFKSTKKAAQSKIQSAAAVVK